MPGEDWIDREIADALGPYGRVQEVFVEPGTGRPGFAVVQTATAQVVVPLQGARLDGEQVVLGVRRDQVLTAPPMRGAVDEIPIEAGDRVLAAFGLEREAADQAADEATEITLSEERLEVRKERRATERVRMRKEIVREEVTLTVTVEREELVIEREPLAPGDDPGAGETGFAPQETEFVLYAEEPVVERRIVPVERVRVRRGEVTESRQITDEVRREQLDVDETTIEERPT